MSEGGNILHFFFHFVRRGVKDRGNPIIKYSPTTDDMTPHAPVWGLDFVKLSTAHEGP